MYRIYTYEVSLKVLRACIRLVYILRCDKIEQKYTKNKIYFWKLHIYIRINRSTCAFTTVGCVKANIEHGERNNM